MKSSNMYYSLLDDAIISVRHQDGVVKHYSLPEIYTALLDDSILSFESLQPHQQQSWYCFLVQLAAMAVARENHGDIPTSTLQWREILLALSKSEAAWHLIVEDISSPAFMQSPIPEGSLEEAQYRSDIKTPDDLDMLITSKNHDLKRNRILYPNPEHWFYALLNLQTMDGYGGPKNYGIIRMNGAHASRPFVGLARHWGWGIRFLRDLSVLLRIRPTLARFYDLQGYPLLWLIPWSGKSNSSIPIEKCDPFFLEICRRIRFTINDGHIVCNRSITESRRISAVKDLNGRTMDPWTPIEKKGEKSLTLSRSGFTYKLIHQLLLGEEYEKPEALKFQDDEKKGAYLYCQALARGKNKTFGLHKKVVPIPLRAASILATNTSQREQLFKIADQRLALTHEIQKKVIEPAIRALLNNGNPGKIEYANIAPWIGRFDREIDHRFFESLWSSIDLNPDEAKKKWEDILLQEAKSLYFEAERSIPISQFRKFKAVSNARSIFFQRIYEILEYAGKRKETPSNQIHQHA